MTTSIDSGAGIDLRTHEIVISPSLLARFRGRRFDDLIQEAMSQVSREDRVSADIFQKNFGNHGDYNIYPRTIDSHGKLENIPPVMPHTKIEDCYLARAGDRALRLLIIDARYDDLGY